MLESQPPEYYLDRAVRADAEASSATTPELAKQWRDLADTYRKIAATFHRMTDARRKPK